MRDRARMNIQHPAVSLVACFAIAGCSTTPDENAELKQMGEEEIQRRFPTLSVACVPEVRLDSWAWLSDHNLIIWTHAQRRNAYWLQMETSCIAMRQDNNMTFRDGDGDRRICGTGNDAVESMASGIQGRCRIGSVRPLDPLELNQVLIYFGKPPLPVRPDDLEDEAPPDEEE